MNPRFEFLEHISDAYVAAYGRDVKEAFENAALGMFEVMTDTNKIEQKIEEEIQVEGYDEKALLYNWLEQLLLRFEIDRRLYSRFEVTELLQSDKNWRLRAKVFGEPFDSAKHESRVEIKAVTYHRMEVKEEGDKCVLKFILDL